MLPQFVGLLQKIFKDVEQENGQALSEYALIIFLFAIAMMLAFSSFTSALGALYLTIQNAFS